MKRLAAIAMVLAVGGFSACGSDEPAADNDPPASSPAPNGFTIVSPDDVAELLVDAPDDLVVLDVRTPEEFAQGHLDGAVLVDFYDADFADQLAELDPDVPYVVYCRSGNRSGQTLPLMQELGFASAADIDGGILAWADAGLPVVTE